MLVYSRRQSHGARSAWVIGTRLVTSAVTAALASGAEVEADGTVTIDAVATPQAVAATSGVNAGGAAVGGSTAEATVAPIISAFVGESSRITAENLDLHARQNLPGNGESASASATGSSGGLLVGVNATNATATGNGQVSAYVGKDSVLEISESAHILANLDSAQYSTANGKSFGIVAVGGNKAASSSDTTVSSYLAEGVSVTGGVLTIEAGGTENNQAAAISGSGGLVSVSASEAYTSSTNTTLAAVGAKGSGTGINVNSLNVIAGHETLFNGSADSSSGGVVDAPGATIGNTTDTDVEARIGDGAAITAEAMSAKATTTVLKDWLSGYNLISASGGVGAFPAGASTTIIANETRVRIGDHASVLVSDGHGGGDIALTVHNDVTAGDKAKIDAGGAIATARTESRIYNDTNTAEIVVGDATLQAGGAIAVSNWTDLNLHAQADAKTYGAAGYAQGISVAHASPQNIVTIADGAAIEATGDIAITVGGTADDLRRADISVAARTDLWNKTAFPIRSNPTADAVVNHACQIDVAEDAWIGSNQDVLLAVKGGTRFVSGTWNYQDAYMGLAEDIANGFISLFTGSSGSVSLKESGGSEQDNLSRNVNIDGTVEAGLNNKQFLIVDETLGATVEPTMSGTPGLVFTRTVGEDSIVRATGSWLDDGFSAGTFLRVSGAGDLDGAYLIKSVTATTITLNAKTPLGGEDEPAIGTLAASGVTVSHFIMTGAPKLAIAPADNTITRSVGSFVEDGFLVGQWILVDGAGTNDNFYRISGFSGDGMVMYLHESSTLVASAQNVSGVTIRAVAEPSIVVEGSVYPLLSIEREVWFSVTTTILRPAGSGSFIDDGFGFGQYVRIAGSSNSANDGTYQITGVTALTLTLLDSGFSMTPDTTGEDPSILFAYANEHSVGQFGTLAIDAGNKTITHSSSGHDFEGDGFAAGQTLLVTGTANAGTYTIASVDDNVITLNEALTVNATGVDASAITAYGGYTTVQPGSRTMTFDAATRTITRNDGVAWTDVAAGQTIAVSGSQHNTGIYTVAGVSGTVITLTASESLADESHAFGVTILATTLISTGTTLDLSLTHTDPRDSVERDSGSWTEDGFEAGMVIHVSNSGANDGAYLINEVNGTTIFLHKTHNLTTQTLAAGGTTEIASHPPRPITIHTNTLKGNPELTFTNVYGGRDLITRSAGSWLTDGFLEGQTITVSGAGANDGVYTIATISTDGLTIGLSMQDSLVSASGVGGVAVSGTGISSGVSVSLSVEDLGVNIAKEIDRLQKLKAEHYGNAAAIAGYNAQITQLKMQALYLGLIDASDPGLLNENTPLSPKQQLLVTYIVLPDITASSGNIEVTAGTLTGSGNLYANNDTSVVIENASPYYLRVGDV